MMIQVADLVLLLVDASFGFEMETFEFLNILQVYSRTYYIIQFRRYRLMLEARRHKKTPGICPHR